ncbi:oxygen-dependent coproporphyrinogen-III oxidase [Prolixibacter bellariivorans]|uniref:coproporphyrinogen oxidase n=1 Tax=Prolixibacter bellariivorans TaxID=314319 RepID=A0A5M4B259_9BACT|nr:oxygen-dependent coproporphyrinogen oxidase [Prolixibacter bellariivorans]GET34154.1 oxygen-dependent coproporphyrinogen-III oxidase [Prolixibacter bellariivorans]
MKETARIAELYSELQEKMCARLEQADGKATFSRDAWKKNIGGGMTRVIAGGNKIAKGAINFSHVEGTYSAQMEKLLGEKASAYAATGISSILHPVNPHAPIIHMNVRHFSLDNGVQWFGGGIDLTPHYIDKAGAQLFHRKLKEICDHYSPSFYPDYKKWADDYFFIPHRDETRGVGGIFFDRLKPTKEIPLEKLIQFTVDLASAYPEMYAGQLARYADKPFTEREEKWQRMRRGRYVEFNLVYDRGTKFGLASGGNTESILVSMPPEAVWEYNYTPEPGSREAETLSLLKKDMDWINCLTD